MERNWGEEIERGVPILKATLTRCLLPEGGQGSELPVTPHPHQQEAPLSPCPLGGASEAQPQSQGRGRGSGRSPPCLLGQREGPAVRRLTHSIEEVSELVLLKAGSQEVMWGLQYTLFEPTGVGGCL